MKKPWTKEGKHLETVAVKGKHGQILAGRWKSNDTPDPPKQQAVINIKTPIQGKQGTGTRSKGPAAYLPIDGGAPLDPSVVYSMYKQEHTHAPFEKWARKKYVPWDGVTSIRETLRGNKARERMQDAIVQGIVNSANGPKNGYKPVAILMGGGPASGKSTVVDAVVKPWLEQEGIRPGVCDCDTIKTQLPEWGYLNRVAPETASYPIHAESVSLSKRALYTLIDKGKNLIYDNTMRVVSEYDGLIDKLHKKGYHVIIVAADTDIETAKERSHKRERVLPDKKLIEIHRNFATAFDFIKHKADSFTLYDTTDDQLHIIEDETGVKDEKLMQRFYDKGKNGHRRRMFQNLAAATGTDAEELWTMYTRDRMTEDEIINYVRKAGAQRVQKP